MADSTSSDSENLHYRIRREASGAWGWLRGRWRDSRWFRRAGYAIGVLLLLIGYLSPLPPRAPAGTEPKEVL